LTEKNWGTRRKKIACQNFDFSNAVRDSMQQVHSIKKKEEKIENKKKRETIVLLIFVRHSKRFGNLY